MAPALDEKPRTARFYTTIRRIPLLIGKAGNTQLPGGPYTPAQFGVGLIVLVVGYQTMPLWGPMVGRFPLVRLIALLIATVFIVWASGQLPTSKRQLHNLAIDGFGAVVAPAAGKLNGRAVRLTAPHLVGGVVLIGADPLDEHLPAESPGLAPAPVVASTPLPSVPAAPTSLVASRRATPTPPAFASGLDRLLEQARTKES